MNKARKYSSPLLDELLDEITPLEMEQTKVKMQLAARIADLMKSKDWNKSKLAEMTGKNPSEITKWLSGTQNFTIDILTEIASVFGIEVSSLWNKQPIQVITRTNFVVKAIAVEHTISMTRSVTPPAFSEHPNLFSIKGIQSFNSQYYRA